LFQDQTRLPGIVGGDRKADPTEAEPQSGARKTDHFRQAAAQAKYAVESPNSPLFAIGTIVTGIGIYLLQEIKSDIQILKSDLKSDLNGVKSNLNGVKSDLEKQIDGVKSDLVKQIDGVKSDLQNIKNDMTEDRRNIFYLATNRADLIKQAPNNETTLASRIEASTSTSAPKAG